MSDEGKPVRMLAAAVLVAAARDYERASSNGAREECAQFLLSNSVWHEIVNLSPVTCARWIRRQPKLRPKPSLQELRQRAQAALVAKLEAEGIQ